MTIMQIFSFLTILTSINGYIIQTRPSRIDCSKYSNDDDLIHRFPFIIHTNAHISKTAMTNANFNDKNNVISLKIADEKCVPLLIFCLKHLAKLEIVNTSFCHSEQRIPPEIELLAASLTELHISGTKIPYLPKELSKLKRLHKLRLINVGLKSLPDWIGDMISFNFLILSQNNLSNIPGTMRNLPALQQLTLSDNPNLRSIKSLNGHPSLRSLDTRNCPIERLPQNLPQLMELRMSNNSLTNLYGIESLGEATDGNKMFDFDGNGIRSITHRISSVRNLYTLNIGRNLLTDLPSDIFNISTLVHLNIQDNCFPLGDLKKYISKFYTKNPTLKLSYDQTKVC